MSATKQRRVRIIAEEAHETPRDWDNLGTVVTWHSRYALGDKQPILTQKEYQEYLAVLVCPRLGYIIEYWQNDGYYRLIDKYDGDHGTAWQEVDKHVRSLVDAVLDRYYVILPVYLFDHSGITISTSPFQCPWDSGQVGYIYASLDDAKQNWLIGSSGDWDTTYKDHNGEQVTIREGTRRHLQVEIETYDQYIRGDVYGFVVEECEPCECCGHLEWEHVDSCSGFYGDNPETNGMAGHLDADELELAKSAEIEYSR